MKKLVALVLTLVLSISLIACYQVSASDDEWKNNTGTINLDSLKVTGNGVEVEGNTVIITSGGDFTVTGSLKDGMIRVNAEDKVKLRLSGMSLTNSTGPAIYFENAEKAFITITEDTENYLSDGTEYSVEDADAALFSNDDLEIKGAGKLTINANYKHGIASDDDLAIENGTIIIASNEHGIKANDKVSITGGTLDITAKTGKGIKAGSELVIDDGVISIVSEESEGMESKGTLTINGGDINIISADDGINTGNENSASEQSGDKTFNEGEMPQRSDSGEMPGMKGNRQMNGEMPEMGEMPQDGRMMQQAGENGEIPGMKGNRQMNGEMPEMGEMPQGGRMMQQAGENGEMSQDGLMGGFGKVDEETAAAHAITINGGNIYIKANGDGIDSNGSLTINGGKIVIDGPEMRGNGPFDSEGEMKINGGEVVTLSSAGMLQLPNNSDGQSILSVMLSNQGKAGDKVTVKDSEGNEVFTHTAATGYMALLYSSPDVKEGNEYSIYVNDELVKTVTVTKGTGAYGNAGNMMGGFGGREKDGQSDQGTKKKNVSVSVNGKSVSFNTNPVIKNDTTLVGFRAILEMLGAEVTWDEATKTVTAKKDGVDIILTINSDKAKVNGKEYTLLTAPEIINDSTMIPVRFVSENLGMDVLWNGDNQHIEITSKS
ncbi:MAG: carbohydrate-binding domain-containing protein [Firmicutes bacterium]|nr:carbohydrate-binding domain-containing protein [Bacillota bacterium]